MRSTAREALDALRALGTPAEIRQLASSGYGPTNVPKVNAHIHLPPNFSAFESVGQAVDLAMAEGIGVLGVSNYYDYEVYGDFVQLARAAGIFPLFGLEIISLDDELVSGGVKVNDPGNPGKIYICGKGITCFDEMTDEARRLLGVIRRNDSERMSAVVDSMARVIGERGLSIDVDAEKVKDLVVNRHGSVRETVYLQERHAAQAFQEAIFEKVDASERQEILNRLLGSDTGAKSPEDHVAVQNDLRSHLMKAGKPAFVEETFVSFEEARRLILELGGIPSYPTLADGAQPICPFEDPVDNLIDRILSRDVYAAEFIPTRNAPEVLGAYVRAMRAAGLAVTAGTEHNTLDLIALEPTCVGGAAIPDEIQRIFWEGACVVAAHQFLTLHGECGYVDRDGKPNGDYSNADERIGDFAALGAAVIQRFSAVRSGENGS